MKKNPASIPHSIWHADDLRRAEKEEASHGTADIEAREASTDGAASRLDDVPVDEIKRFESEFLQFLETKHPAVLSTLREKKEIDEQLEKDLRAAIDAFKEGFRTETA